MGALGDSRVGGAAGDAVYRSLTEDPFSQAALNAQNAAGAQDQMKATAANQEQLKAQMARSGMSSSGAAAELAVGAQNEGQAAFANLKNKNQLEFQKMSAEQKNQAIQTATQYQDQLRQSGVDIENLRMNREQIAMQVEAARAAAAKGPGDPHANDIEIMNSDGSTSWVPLDMIEMVLGLGEGGMF